MRLKFSALLLSSILASVSYGAEINEAAGVETVQHVISQKVVPDGFEGTGEYCFKSIAEYRSRRAALESRLHSFQGQKLKVFTPEIFAEMLEEGVQITELGLHIFEKLPTIAGQINERLASLESRIKSKNALITWRELAALMQEIKGFPEYYWNEFKFDMGHALRSSELQPQVVAAHENTLSQSERWIKVNQASRNGLACNMDVYIDKVDSCKDAQDELVEHKFTEERDDSIARAVDFFRAKLSVGDLGIRFDVSHKKFCDNNPLDAFEKWLRKKMLGESASAFEPGIFYIHGFVVKRNLLSDYIQDSSELSEWIGFNEYASKMENTKFYEDRLIDGEPVELQPGLTMSNVYAEIRTKVESVIQTALDETFAWLMTQ